MERIANFLWLIAAEASVAALLLLCDALLPGTVARAREQIAATPVRAGLVGLINLAFFGLVSVALFSVQGLGTILGGALALAIFAVAAIGLAAIVRIVAARLDPARAATPRGFLGAGATLLLAASAPFIGWFVVLPLALCVGSGGAIIALLRRRAPAQVTVAPPAPPPEPPPAGAWAWPPPPPPTSGGNMGGPM